MSSIQIIGVGAVVTLALLSFVLARRRGHSGRRNGWKNEAYLAREAAGSWTENECAVGRENRAPQTRIIPGGS